MRLSIALLCALVAVLALLAAPFFETTNSVDAASLPTDMEWLVKRKDGVDDGDDDDDEDDDDDDGTAVSLGHFKDEGYLGGE
jgi:hypothetical protein